MWSDMDSDAPTSTKLARIMNVATTTTVFLIRFSLRSSFFLDDSDNGCLVDRKWRGRPEVVSASESTRMADGRTTLAVVALTFVKVISCFNVIHTRSLFSCMRQNDRNILFDHRGHGFRFKVIRVYNSSEVGMVLASTFVLIVTGIHEVDFDLGEPKITCFKVIQGQRSWWWSWR